ncbi:MAG: hypothetical protein ACT4PS_16720 [Betaproteobacteria bacterium]
MRESIAAVSPEGEEAVARVRRARRLDALAGETVCEFWNGVFKGDITFPLIRRRLQERYPGLTIVPYTEFPHAPGSDDPARQREHAVHLATLARERGADAVISGNGA